MKPNQRRSQLTAALALFGCITLSACGGGDQDESAALPSVPVDPNACTTGPAQTPVDTAFCRGKANFHDRTLAGLGGNGRACSDCHMDSENFQLTPAAAQARFAQMTMTGVDDPLFRAIDADDFRVNGAAAHDFTNLTQNGLIRVTIPLPANVKLLDCGATVPCPASALPTNETVADVWRSVPSILDVSITGPDGAGPAWPRGPNLRGRLPARRPHRHAAEPGARRAAQPCRGHGRSAGELSGRPGSLPECTVLLAEREGAVGRHRCRHEPAARSRSRAERPGDGWQVGLQPGMRPVPRRSWAAIRAAAPRSCRARRARRPPSSVTTTSSTACPRPVDNVSPPRFSFAPCSPSQMENVRTYEITNSGVAPSGTPCGGALLSPPASPGSRRRIRAACSSPATRLAGGPGDIQHMDIPNLRGISRTAPYFMNNTAATLEEMLEHYKQFFKRVADPEPCRAPAHHAAGSHSAGHRPSVYRRRGSGAPRLPSQALIDNHIAGLRAVVSAGKKCSRRSGQIGTIAPTQRSRSEMRCLTPLVFMSAEAIAISTLIGASPRSCAPPGTAVKCVRAHDLHTPLHKRLIQRITRCDPSRVIHRIDALNHSAVQFARHSMVE